MPLRMGMLSLFISPFALIVALTSTPLTGWRPGNEKIMYLFARQTISMVWDFGEANILENVVMDLSPTWNTKLSVC